MARSIRATKKRRGRPKTTGTGVQIGMRWHQPTLGEIDDWAARQIDKPGRPEAIRRLVELGLSGSPSPQQGAPKGAAKAKAIAEAKIEPLIDPNVPEKERQKRKRKLLKGPSEFREMRANQPNPKPGR